MDMATDRLGDVIDHERFHFFEGDITINKEWIEYHVRKCDTVLPLVAIATPATYVKEPLRVFELDFEANLPIVRSCVKYRKRADLPVDVRGLRHVPRPGVRSRDLRAGARPDQRSRAGSTRAPKQLIDRVIWAYGVGAGPRLHAVPPVQLDRRRPRLARAGQGRQLARDHPVPRAHRARGADQAGRRRPAEALLHRRRRRHRRAAPDHREQGPHRDRQDLQHRQPAQQRLGPRARGDDARDRGAATRSTPRGRRR